MKISRELVAAYNKTNYCVSAPNKAFALRVGEVCEDARKLMAASSAAGAVFITAWNPFGELVAEAENTNTKANEALKNELDQLALTVFFGKGSSPDASWYEDSFFAFPVSRATATDLCCWYAQNAVVFVAANGIPELIFHPSIK